MKARSKYRDRPQTQVAVLDALVERNDEGMTVLELRASTDVDIDDLEEALAALKRDGLIYAEDRHERTMITVDEAVLPSGETPNPEPSLVDRLRDRLGL
jgi:DNA-binding transcriptional ArsR family regulator